MAAKGKYREWLTEDGLLLLEGWARDGLTDEQIAHNIGIGERTFTEWKSRFSAISAALKKGKAPVDYHVENALYKSATGYIVKVRKPMRLRSRRKTGDAELIEEERIEYVEEEVYVRPDVTAQIYWLKNRRRGRWCDRPPEIDMAQADENDGFLEALSGTAAEDWSDEE